jgi:hypothetical protein
VKELTEKGHQVCPTVVGDLLRELWPKVGDGLICQAAAVSV